ncbi:cytochrome P450 [Sedimentitalea sp.]|uniref:cytochrome P450 n=1 Tax=Sedimentitalea sp. TaxID=2048915 RepID=UPI003298A825
MSDAPITNIDLKSFTVDPYPTLAQMRRSAPITYVPQLGATLITRRDDVHAQEKRIDVFSSVQPEGLMTQLMGENMMRKDGAQHQHERRILFPALSPRTVQDHWKPIFERAALSILQDLHGKGACDLVRDYAMPVSAEALKAITGLTDMQAAEMDGVSQAMIDGCTNYSGDPDITARCKTATALIDAHIDRMKDAAPPRSALDVQLRAGLADPNIRANIKLIISGGQNEPRDAIAGTIWALLTHPDQLQLILNGQAKFAQAFTEYARWISPIGMSPRRIGRTETVQGVTFEPEDKAFLMFSSACRDEAHFDNPDSFDITRNTQPAISFGAGPHFCAGAAASRSLIAEVALPLAFKHLNNLQITEEVPFTGWAFRGPTHMPVRWDC